MRFLDGGFLPARPAVFDDPEIQKKYPYAKSAQASFEILKPRPVTPFYPQMSADAIQPAFGQAMAQQIKPDAGDQADGRQDARDHEGVARHRSGEGGVDGRQRQARLTGRLAVAGLLGARDGGARRSAPTPGSGCCWPRPPS